jgi:RNA polymerase sigma factor (sigma-70 family)
MSNIFDNLPEILPPKERREFEKTAAARIAAGGGLEAINKLVMANMREAIAYTMRTSRGALTDSELMSLCYKELCMSAPRFRPGATRFFSFSKMGLRMRIVQAITDRDVVKKATKIVSISPPDGDAGFTSSDTPTQGEGSGEFKGELIPGVEKSSGYADEMETLFKREEYSILSEMIKSVLSESDQMLLNLVYLNHFSFQDVANMLGVSRTSVHNNHKRILEVLKNVLRQDGRLLEEARACES